MSEQSARTELSGSIGENEDFDVIADNVLLGDFSEVTFRNHGDVIAVLRARQREMAPEHMYDEIAEIETAIARLKEVCVAGYGREAAAQRELRLRNKIERHREQLAELEAQWREKVGAVVAKRDADMEEAQLAHDQALADLESEPIIPEAGLRHHSERYRLLRQRQKALTLTRKFPEARSVREEADRLEALEDEQAGVRAAQLRALKMQALRAEWDERLSRRLARWDRKVETVERAAQEALQHLRRSGDYLMKGVNVGENEEKVRPEEEKIRMKRAAADAIRATYRQVPPKRRRGLSRARD